jgi:hypothetical protein
MGSLDWHGCQRTVPAKAIQQQGTPNEAGEEIFCETTNIY